MLIVVLSYHALFDLKSNQRVGKTAVAKKLREEKGISVCKADSRLDVNLFLDKLPSWEPGRLHHLYLYQRMFAHMEAAGQKECDHGICWGHWQPSPERDLNAEVPAMELLTQETTWEVMDLYHEVYQLKRGPREVPCLEDTAEETHVEILEILKEHLWHRQGPTQPEREPRQGTPRLPAQAEFHSKAQPVFDHFGQYQDKQ